jgi:hypothetical protein
MEIDEGLSLLNIGRGESVGVGLVMKQFRADEVVDLWQMLGSRATKRSCWLTFH